MKREAITSEAYEDVVISVGAPNKSVTDNTAALTGLRWTSGNRRYCIETSLITPHRQQQTYAEGVSIYFKLVVIKLFHNTIRVPLSHWCLQQVF